MNDWLVFVDYAIMDIRNAKDQDDRRKQIEKHLTIELSSIETAFVDDVSDVHCENLIGAISLPLGVAGPANIQGTAVHKDVYIPLATTEGALVASVNRGCKAVRESGGAVVRTELAGVTRGPLFEVSGIDAGLTFKQWLSDHFDELATVAASTSSHLQLKDIDAVLNGRQVYVRFSFDTADAMGMNMVTIATTQIAAFIEKETQARCLAVAGNFDIDKKPAWLNFIQGRGRRGWAEVVIPATIAKKILKVEAVDLFSIIIRKCWGGSILSGSLGFNAHFANIVAAFFVATGQDIAHVVEGSHGVTNAEILANGDLYFSVYMPSIMIGTVGGGTTLQTQREAQSITGAKNAEELAEVLVAAVLAGELSLLASITEHSLAKAHKKLGR